jgi:hypothetical protein
VPPKVEFYTATQSSHCELINAHYRALMSLTPLIWSQTSSPIAPNLNSSIPKVRFGAKMIQVSVRGFRFGVCGFIVCFEVAHCAAALVGLVVTGATGLFVGL